MQDGIEKPIFVFEISLNFVFSSFEVCFSTFVFVLLFSYNSVRYVKEHIASGRPPVRFL